MYIKKARALVLKLDSVSVNEGHLVVNPVRLKPLSSSAGTESFIMVTQVVTVTVARRPSPVARGNQSRKSGLVEVEVISE